MPASETTSRITRALGTVGRGARGFASALALPGETRDSATLAAQAKATYRGGQGAEALFGTQSEELKDTQDFLEAYADRPWVYSCVRRIAKSSKVAPLTIKPDKPDAKALDKHPILNLFKSPNPTTSGGLFVEQELTDLKLCGNFYAEVVYGKAASSVPLQLYRMNPAAVEIVIDTTTGDIAGYLFNPGGGQRKVFLLPHQVWHRRLANPLDPYRGLPPLSAARSGLIFEYQAKQQINSYFANGMRFSGVMSGPENVDSTDLALVRRTVEGRHRGSANSNKMLILPGQWKYEDMSGKPQDSDWIEGLGVSRRETCAVYGVAPPLAGDFSEGTTYSNLDAAIEEFWQSTMTEEYASRADDINHALLPLFGAAGVGVVVSFDLTDTPAFVDDRDKRFARAVAAYNGGVITLDEARDEAGDSLEPLKNGDKRRQMINVEEIPADEPIPDEPDPVVVVPPAVPPVDPNADPPDDPPPPAPAAKQADPLPHVDTHGSGASRTHADYPAARKARTGPIVKKSTAAVVKTMATQRDDLVGWITTGLHATNPDEKTPQPAPSNLPEIIGAYAWLPAEEAFEKTMRATHLLAGEQAWEHSESVGLGVSWDLNDPTVLTRLDSLRNRPDGIKSIVGNQREAVLDEVRKGMSAGASLQQIISGGTVKQADGTAIELDGIRGVYAPWAQPGAAWKAQRVARTETGTAYNLSSLDSYRAAGWDKVNVFDGDSDEECAAADGAVWDISEAEQRPLEHPNCQRAFSVATDA